MAAMEEPIRVVIADDHEDMRRIERMLIERAEGFVIAGEARDGAELLTLVEQQKPQLVFLDVEMPEKTGVECARIIQDMNPAIVMIFATAHDEYMGDAFEVYAFDYLLKPFRKERVMQTLERAKKRIRHQRDLAEESAMPPMHLRPKIASGRLMLHHRDGVSFLKMSDIALVSVKIVRLCSIPLPANAMSPPNRWRTRRSAWIRPSSSAAIRAISSI